MAIDADRDALHALLDAIPSNRLADARAALEPLADQSTRAPTDIPEDDEPVTDEDRAALAATHESYRRGGLIPHDDLKRELGL